MSGAEGVGDAGSAGVVATDLEDMATKLGC